MSKPIHEPGRAPLQPIQSERSKQAEVERRRREAAALRENLAKRKAQQRLRRPPVSGNKASGGAQTQD